MATLKSDSCTGTMCHLALPTNFLIAQPALSCRQARSENLGSCPGREDFSSSRGGHIFPHLALSRAIWQRILLPSLSAFSLQAYAGTASVKIYLPRPMNQTEAPPSRKDTSPGPLSQKHGSYCFSSSTHPYTSLLIHQQKQVEFLPFFLILVSKYCLIKTGRKLPI